MFFNILQAPSTTNREVLCLYSYQYHFVITICQDIHTVSIPQKYNTLTNVPLFCKKSHIYNLLLNLNNVYVISCVVCVCSLATSTSWLQSVLKNQSMQRHEFYSSPLYIWIISKMTEVLHQSEPTFVLFFSPCP